MKLRLLSAIFALVVPLVACNSDSNPNASPSAATPASPVPQASEIPSPLASASSSPEVATNSSPTTAAPTDWYTYSSQEGGYTAKFPQKPEEQKKPAGSQAGSIGYTEVRYVDQAKQRIYLSVHANVPVPPGAKVNDINVEKGLDTLRDNIIKSMKGTVKNETKVTQNGYAGRELTMSMPQGFSAKARIFINPKTLKIYQVLVGSKDGNVNFSEANAFLDSVTIEQ